MQNTDAHRTKSPVTNIRSLKPTWRKSQTDSLKLSCDLCTWPTQQMNISFNFLKKNHLNVHNSIVHNFKMLQTNRVSTSWWRDKTWYSHMIEYYETIDRSEVPINVWTTLQEIILNEISQTQKTTYCILPFMWSEPNRQIHKNIKSLSCSSKLGR